MTTLPKGWVEARIGDLCTFNPKHSPDEDRSKLAAFVPMPAVDEIGGRIVEFENRQLEDIWRGYTHFQDGDVIFSKITPCMENGKIAVARDLTNGLACGSTEFHVMRSEGALVPEYLWRYLRQKAFRATAEKSMTGAVGQRRVPKHFLEEWLLPLPPLPEQKRIVAKVESLTAKSARARAELDKIDKLATSYKKAVLNRAFAGELTKDWRHSRNVPEPSRLRLDKLCASVTDGDHQAPPRAEDGIPFITISAMNDGQIRLDKASRFVPRSYYEGLKPSRRPEIDNVLYSVTGSIGIPALVETSEPFVFQRHIAILKPDHSKATSRFLFFLLAAPQILEQAMAVATGTAQLTIPLSGLRAFELPAPSLEEQREIVRRIETAFAKIDRLAAEAKRALELTDRLDEKILAKAFRGELVPQDPNDEPASVLLDRVRTERAAAPKKGRGRKSTKA